MVGMNLRLSFKCTVTYKVSMDVTLSPTLCKGGIIILRNNKALRSEQGYGRSLIHYELMEK